MNFLKSYSYSRKIIKYDLINKFIYKNNKTMPKLINIILSFGCKNFNIQKFAITLLALEILTLKKSTLSAQRKNVNVLLKLQKGQPAGCKVILEKKEINTFLTKLHLEIFPKLKNFAGFKFQIENSIFSFQLVQNEIILPEFENQYPLFSGLTNLNIHVCVNSKNQKELIFLLKSMKFPLRIFG